jgi:UDP-N-acetyl-D-mannosaminuronic acid transferase (WecB/TagA/CpsF family)
MQPVTFAAEAERLIPRQQILGVNVDCTSYAHTIETIRDWARRGLSKYVCVAAVNNVMEGYDSDECCYRRFRIHAWVRAESLSIFQVCDRFGHDVGA